MGERVGIDIGSTTVRVVEVSAPDSEGMVTIRKVGMAPLREGAVLGGRIRDPQRVSLALMRALKEAGVSKRGGIVGLSTPDAAVARVEQAAALKPEERMPALRRAKYTPTPAIPTSEAAMALNVARTYTTGEGFKMNSLVVAAALTSELKTLQDACHIAGVLPRAVDLTGAATMRAMTRSYGGDEIATVVDIGATKVTIATRQGLHLRSIRTAAGGGMDITRAIMRDTNEDFETAERRKQLLRLGGSASAAQTLMGSAYGLDDEPDVDTSRATSIEDALATAVDPIIEQVALSIEADAEMYGSYTQGITLCGGTSLLRGLKEALQTRIGVPVQVSRPWATLAKNGKTARYFTADGSENPVVLLGLATAVGLALWKESE